MTSTPQRKFAARLGGGVTSDRGFTLVELSVALVVLAIVLVLVFGLIVGLQQQQVNEQATVAGSRSSQLADEELIQYLRAAGTPVPGSNVPTGTTETSTSLTLPAYLGTQYTTTGGQEVPAPTTTLAAKVISCTTQCEQGTEELQVTFTGNSGSKKTSQLDTFYIVTPTAPIFTYEEYASTGGPSLVPMSTSGVTSSACMAQIVAIKLDVSFLAGPGDSPTRSAAADLPTTLETTVFLQNTNLVYGSTTTSTTSVLSC